MEKMLLAILPVYGAMPSIGLGGSREKTRATTRGSLEDECKS
mgnify:CR=1 FL=1